MSTRCWYCGNATVKESDPVEHIVPLTLGGSLTTKCVCFDCNQRAGKEIDQPFVREWFIAVERARWGIETRTGRRPPQPKAKVELSDGSPASIDYSSPAWRVSSFPDRVSDKETLLLGFTGNVDYVDELTRGIADREGLDLSTLEQEVSPFNGDQSVTVKFTYSPLLWRRMCVKIALGLASLSWDEAWLDTNSAAELRDWLWSDDPDPPALFTVPTGGIAMFLEAPNHCLVMHPGGQWTTVLVSLFGAFVVNVRMHHDGAASGVDRVWILDPVSRGIRQLTLDEAMTEAALRVTGHGD